MKRADLMNERLAALFALGLVIFMPPFIGAINSPTLVLGIPTLALALFAFWAAFIGLVAFIVERSDPGDEAPADVADAEAGDSEPAGGA